MNLLLTNNEKLTSHFMSNIIIIIILLSARCKKTNMTEYFVTSLKLFEGFQTGDFKCIFSNIKLIYNRGQFITYLQN